MAAERTPAAPTLTPVRLDSGLVLYQGGYQSLAVRQHDGIVVIEAPESEAKSRAVLADLRERFAGVPIKGVVTTSPMWAHIGGLREYVARGIPVYVLDANVPIISNLIAAPHSIGSGLTRAATPSNRHAGHQRDDDHRGR